MAIRTFVDKTPIIANTVYVDPTALVIGDVVIGEHSSIWPMTVIRGDVNSIRIGNNTNIQDHCVIHVNHAHESNPGGDPVYIGDEVTVGHRVVLHGCTIENHCLIGIGSIIMDKVIVRSEVIVGAGSLVPPGKVLESGYLWLGSPVKKMRELTDMERQYLRYSAEHYARVKDKY